MQKLLIIFLAFFSIQAFATSFKCEGEGIYKEKVLKTKYHVNEEGMRYEGKYDEWESRASFLKAGFAFKGDVLDLTIGNKTYAAKLAKSYAHMSSYGVTLVYKYEIEGFDVELMITVRGRENQLITQFTYTPNVKKARSTTQSAILKCDNVVDYYTMFH